ncbi:MAG: hypothetical protein ABJN21_05245 [Paracoccaceae bacterium]
MSKVMLADALQSHHMIITALLGLWVTGLTLIYLRTGFDLGEFAPKVFMKLVVVSLLSVNAVVISTYVLPVMDRFKDRPLLAIPLAYKLPMAVSAASSILCWFSALALGSMAFFKTQTWDSLASAFGFVYFVGLLVAISIALWVHVPELKDHAESA